MVSATKLICCRRVNVFAICRLCGDNGVKLAGSTNVHFAGLIKSECASSKRGRKVCQSATVSWLANLKLPRVDKQISYFSWYMTNTNIEFVTLLIDVTFSILTVEFSWQTLQQSLCPLVSECVCVHISVAYSH